LFRPDVRFGLLVLIAVGIALALSRGGIVAAVAGVAILILALIRRRPDRPSRALPGLVRNGGLALSIAIGGYVGLSWLAANGVGLRPGELASVPDQPQGTLVPVASVASSTPPSTSAPTTSRTPQASEPAPTASPPPTRAATQPPSYVGAGDTIELRVRNLQVAIGDGLTSPILGLGPDTFGQRYEEPTCACPAHIPNQLSATFYESGVIGLVSLLFVLGWVIVRGLQRRLDVYVASLATLLIGFQFTDALRFGATWLLIARSSDWSSCATTPTSRSAERHLVRRDRPVGALAPGQIGGAPWPCGPEPRPERLIGQPADEASGESLIVGRVDQDRRIARDLGDRCRVARHHDRTDRERLGHRQAEALVDRRVGHDGRATVEPLEDVVRYVAGEDDPPLSSNGRDRGVDLVDPPARLAGDDEPDIVQPGAADPIERPNQARDVLARVEIADSEHEAIRQGHACKAPDLFRRLESPPARIDSGRRNYDPIGIEVVVMKEPVAGELGQRDDGRGTPGGQPHRDLEAQCGGP